MNATYILWAAYFPVALSLAFVLVVFRSLRQEFKILAWFILLTGVIQLGGRILSSQSVNNYPLLHLYVCFGGVLLTQFYSQVFIGFINRKWMHYGSLAYIVLVLTNSLLIQSIWTFNSNALVMQAVLLIVLSLSCFVFSLRYDRLEQNQKRLKSLNWINSGLFIYFSGNLLLYYFGSRIVSSSLIVNKTWAIHAVLSSVMHFCFIVGLWMRPRT